MIHGETTKFMTKLNVGASSNMMSLTDIPGIVENLFSQQVLRPFIQANVTENISPVTTAKYNLY